MIWFNVTNVIQIDGEVSADGRAGGNVLLVVEAEVEEASGCTVTG